MRNAARFRKTGGANPACGNHPATCKDKPRTGTSAATSAAIGAGTAVLNTPQNETQDRSQKISGQIIGGVGRTNRAPDALRGPVHHKSRAVNVRQDVGLHITLFGQRENRFANIFGLRIRGDYSAGKTAEAYDHIPRKPLMIFPLAGCRTHSQRARSADVILQAGSALHLHTQPTRGLRIFLLACVRQRECGN